VGKRLFKSESLACRKVIDVYPKLILPYYTPMAITPKYDDIPHFNKSHELPTDNGPRGERLQSACCLEMLSSHAGDE